MKINAGDGSIDIGDKSTPKDAQVIAAILRDMGITEYEPRVINQLLEFCYRYITTVLDDAKVISGHAKKKNVDADDVKLAVQVTIYCSDQSMLIIELRVGELCHQTSTIHKFYL